MWVCEYVCQLMYGSVGVCVSGSVCVCGCVIVVWVWVVVGRWGVGWWCGVG